MKLQYITILILNMLEGFSIFALHVNTSIMDDTIVKARKNLIKRIGMRVQALERGILKQGDEEISISSVLF